MRFYFGFLVLPLLGSLPLLCISAMASATGVDAAQRVLVLSDEQQQQFACRERGGGSLPFVTISYAQTLDGSIAPLERTRLDISSKTSFRLLHSLRARHDGVLVGINTVLADQPRLNVRDPLPGVAIPQAQPRPIVIDSHLRILDAQNLQLVRPIVCSCLLDLDGHEHSIENEARWVRARMLLESIGGSLLAVKSDPSSRKRPARLRCDLRDCFERLYATHNMASILLEGGAGIIQSSLEARLANQAVITMRPCFLGGYRSMAAQLPAPANLQNVSVASVGGDLVVHGLLWKNASADGDQEEAEAVPGKSDIGSEFVHERPLVRFVAATEGLVEER